MASRWQLRTEVAFSSAHQLRGYDGDCARVHGHNYRVEIEVEANALDDIGLGLDFREIRARAQTLADVFDHRNFNEIPPFTELNPSAENIARHFFTELAGSIAAGPDRERVRVRAVTVHETERCSVRYTED